MQKRRRFIPFQRASFVALAVIVFSICGVPGYGQGGHQLPVRVVDGDTLVLGQETIRLEGIDAPEKGQTCLNASGKPWKCGQAATAYLRDLITGVEVACKGANRDGYDRRVATCFAGRKNLNALMIRSGHAFAFRKYSQTYVAEEAFARNAGSGIWAGTAEAPWDFRARKWKVAEQIAPADCPIKGNISSRGRIYHAPWSPSYSRTRINEAAGERWFCSEAEARAAGWRPPHGS